VEGLCVERKVYGPPLKLHCYHLSNKRMQFQEWLEPIHKLATQTGPQPRLMPFILSTKKEMNEVEEADYRRKLENVQNSTRNLSLCCRCKG
jgi:hypothetical protein